ncbi:MAG: CHAT domain-containing protein, partial [Oceanidesulfovibrio sp.]
HHYTQALEVYTRQAFPADHRRTQRNLANLYFGEGRWAEAVAAFQGALAAGDLLYMAAATPEARRAELREVRDLPADLSYALAQTATDGERASLQEAVLALEQNRARWLGEAFALRSERPPGVPDEAWRRFIAAGEQIRDLQAEARLPEDTPGKRVYIAISQKLSSAHAALEEAVDEVRRHAPDFMPISTFADVQVAAKVSPLVYIAATSAGGLALIVRDDEITPVWLDALTDEALNKRVRGLTGDEWREIFAQWGKGDVTLQGIDKIFGGYLSTYRVWRFDRRNDVARAAWFAALEKTIAWLRETVMRPLRESLPEGAALVTLIPTGDLALLPLHAAPSLPGEKRRPVFTYAPNARALAAARETAAQISPPYSLLAVDNPDGSLRFSDEEVAAALDAFDQTHHLANVRATASAVQAGLPQHSVWHFSTHGRAGWEQPLDGELLVADGTITLRDLLQLQGTRARLAVLSACETGVPGTELPDEVIGLPTGLLQAGVAGVVGSLWAVNDLSTALLMMRFYQAWRVEGQAPPDALHTAQTWLRESTNADFQAYFKAQLPELTGERMPHEVASAAYRRFTFSPDKDARPFAHPFHWAGFYYTGV